MDIDMNKKTIGIVPSFVVRSIERRSRTEYQTTGRIIVLRPVYNLIDFCTDSGHCKNLVLEGFRNKKTVSLTVAEIDNH